MDIDILIVGAGPTGLCLALWMKTIAPDVKILIVDKKSGPVNTSRAIVVHARTLELYKQLGIVDEVLKEGNVVESSTIRTGLKSRGSLVFGNVGQGLSLYPFMLSYTQDKHERLLIRRLQGLGVEVQWNTAVEGLVQHDTHNDVLVGGRQLNAKFVCACDGASSTTRELTSTKTIGDVYPQIFYAADVRAISDQAVTNIAICPRASDIALFIPLDGVNQTRVLGAVRVNKPHEDVKIEDVQPSIEYCTGLKFTSVDWFSTYKVRHSVAEHFLNKRVLFLGDAAHQHSPVGGQGMNTGLGDSANAAWKLAAVVQGKAPLGILDTYDTERKAFAKLLVGTTDVLFGLVTGTGVLGWFIRNIVMQRILPLLWATPFVNKIFFRRISQIELNYRHSKLSQGRVGRVYAGDRLPWFETSTGSNFDTLQNNCWQFHTYGGSPGTSTLLGYPLQQIEFNSSAAKAGLKEHAIYFIRPDGYIGYCASKVDLAAIGEYVDRNLAVD